MYDHMLICTDGSEVAAKGLDHGLALAKALGARATVVTVTEPLPIYASPTGEAWMVGTGYTEEYDASQRKYAGETLAAAREAAGKVGVAVETLHVPDARPADAILEVAKMRGCSLIVMSSHGRRGLGRLLLGSQTNEVVTRAQVPVLVVR